MFGAAKSVYLATRKRHDQLFNTYFMRPIAAAVVVGLARFPVTPNQITILNLAIFVVAAGLLVALPGWSGGLIAIAVLLLSYLFDCCDGMLARHKGIASKQGHLFDFFTDEIKALLLVAGLGIRAYRFDGRGPDLQPMSGEHLLLCTIAAVIVIASATSLTNFVRRPEISGQETPVGAHYESVEMAGPTTIAGRAVGLVMTFLRFLGHYPSHIWIFALAGALDVFFWIYAIIHLFYLGRGWLGLLVRFGRP